MTFTQNGKTSGLTTPRLIFRPIPLPPTSSQVETGSLPPALRTSLYGSLVQSGWDIRMPFDYGAVDEDWISPASFPASDSLTIWIPAYRRSVVVFASSYTFVTVSDVIEAVHQSAQSAFASGSLSTFANQPEPSELGSLLLSPLAGPWIPITATGWMWAGLSLSPSYDEEWVLDLV